MIWPGLTERLEGDLVVLEPLAERHLDDLWAASRDPQIWSWLLGREPTRDELAGWLQYALGEHAAGREGPFATVDATSGRAIGSTRFLNLRPEHRSLEIGWTWLGRGAWRTGANVQSKRLMLEHAFERLGCLRVELKTDARNARSRAAIAGIGARFEGVLRSHMVVPYGDGTRDSAYYAITAADWPEVRARLEGRARRPAGEPGELVLRELGAAELDRVEPLWSALVEHHAHVSPVLSGIAPARGREDAWPPRRAKYVRCLGEPDTFVLVAERDGATVGYAFVTVGAGFACWATDERVAELETLSVLPGERSRGVGAALLDAVGERLTAMGVGQLALTSTTTNVDAHRFYARRGLQPAFLVLYGPAHPTRRP
ncbi:MAG TPA: GNAT family N-acetyltransferase [Solirubrobacteraceae bacterium]|nr:GNAT family N-acetyltransferase [Solirubrobacteraceae bacterium]